MTTRPTVAGMVADLASEHESLDALVRDQPAEAWALPTPAAGWSVADQVGHLAYFDEAAARAIADPEAFTAEVGRMLESVASAADPAATSTAADRAEPDPIEDALVAYRQMSPRELLDAWHGARQALLSAAAGLDDADRIPWYGPSMGAVSFLTARLMETWAHGEDVASALGAVRQPTDRLRHVAQLGVITRRWSYMVRGLPAPAAPVRVALTAPSGELWEWEAGGGQSVTGPALDFCLVVTQRRHVDDTALSVDGQDAAEWMSIAQAFAGGPTLGPARSS